MKSFQLELFDIPLINRLGETEIVLRWLHDDIYIVTWCKPVTYRISDDSEITKDPYKSTLYYIDFDNGPMLMKDEPINFTVSNEPAPIIMDICQDPVIHEISVKLKKINKANE